LAQKWPILGHFLKTRGQNPILARISQILASRTGFLGQDNSKAPKIPPLSPFATDGFAAKT
jgi:hypothetical protein